MSTYRYRIPYKDRGVVLIIFMILIINVSDSGCENSQVDVRAVFINCEPDDRESITDNDATRFEREELFKHSVLQECNKKIALTVKIASEPDKNSGDEYIPVEHVFRAPNKRVRLLNPYVLRLQREIPLQAYKLRRMATVNGIFSNTGHDRLRDSRSIDLKPLSRENLLKPISKSLNAQDCDLTESNNNTRLKKRAKRHEENISNDHSITAYNVNRRTRDKFYEMSRNFPQDVNINLMRNKVDPKSRANDEVNHLDHLRRSDLQSSYPKEQDFMKTRNAEPPDWFLEDRRSLNKHGLSDETIPNERIYADSENEFEMFEIGNPDLLYTVQVQLFEKLTTPEGKTVWNDITKGEPASVSTFSPEWVGQDMNIRYRPTEWIPKEEYTLPLKSLCLLTPLRRSRFTVSEAENIEESDSIKKYIVVPKEDILGLNNENNYVQKLYENSSNVKYSTERNDQYRRRVLIRTSRAIFGSKEDELNIAVNGGDQYLTMPHRRAHHAQIDLEARADENQLVPVGSSARIMTVVADGSRRTRTTLTVQVTNTGLAAAKFRAVARDCGPELVNFEKDNVGDTFSNEYTLLPPRHTRNFLLDVPNEMSADNAHCFGEDPKLLCREMTEARQMAAGLYPRERARNARSVCYHDVVSINLLVTALGVLITLLFFGLVKAILGIVFRCIGSWGLHRLVQMPRKLDHYYESSLRGCSVVYDCGGWPVHPATKERTVRLVSKPMEFILNVIFFVTTPCIIIYEILKEICNQCRKIDDANNWKPSEKDKNCYSSHDIQGQKMKWRKRRRRHEIKKWMTPTAEDLSTNIWQGNLPDKNTVKDHCMHPLLREDFGLGESAVQPTCVDSEGDDTEYVLMQMQKSKESLARSQRKLISEKKVMKDH